jgi:hypothetical protein
VRPQPRLRPGEPPLVVFVSSVMDEEMGQPRQDAVLALEAPQFLAPWAFEFAPASPEPADWSYLTKAAAADALIWLVGSRTTEPVRREIQTAREHDVPLFVIRLEGVEADSDTSALISSLGLDVKWVTVPASEVRSAVALSFGDQIVRAWRGKPGRERSGSLEDIGRWSRARCIASWMATGMTRPEALAFADDLSVGRPPDEVRPRPEHPLCVIVGDAGSGKSLTGERLPQEAVADSIGDPDAPIPVWLRARDVNYNLTASIAKACEGIGNPQRQGVFVVIDGVDEIGSGARTVLNEARSTVEALPGARVVITSRPLPDFERIEETVRLPVLSSEQSLSLIESIVQRRVTGHQWPAAISEAIRRPFYALLLADWLILSRGQVE